MRYYLGPWRWRNDDDGYCSPAGAIGAIDLGRVPEMGRKASARGGCLCWTDGDLPSEFTRIGVGDAREIKRDQRLVDVMSTVTSAGKSPEGDTLADMILDCLLLGAEPLGLSAPRVAEPDCSGWHHLHLWGHGQAHVTAQRFEWGSSRVTSILQASLRDQFRDLHRDAAAGKLRDNLHHLRVLDFWCEQFRVDDWREFVPKSLHKDIPGRLKHETTITDSFNRADNANLGTSSGGWSWTAVAFSSGWGIASNVASNSTNGSIYRADSDLSSSNHYAQAAATASGTTSFVGMCVRFASAANTHYNGMARNNATTTYRLRKMVSGTSTTLNDVSTTAFSSGTIKTEINGTSLTIYNGVSAVNGPITDSSISGNTRTGVVNSVGPGGTLDSFEAADLAASGVTYVQTEKTWRGYRRGYYTFK